MRAVSVRYFTTRIVVLGFVSGLIGACDGSDDDSVGPSGAVEILISPGAVMFQDTIGQAAPEPKTVEITGEGPGTLDGLSVGEITYGGGASGWLSAALSGPEAPATLTLTLTPSGLEARSYSAIVPILSPAASNSPQNLVVTVTMEEAPLPPLPDIDGVTIVAGGNMGSCGGGLQRAAAEVVAAANPDYVFVLGDNAEPRGGEPATLRDYLDCYDPIWGRFLPKTFAAVGGKEQDDDGVSAGADAYFGASRVGPSGRNYYSFDLGSWHIIVLNVVSGGPTRPVRYNNGSAQLNWLIADLRANRDKRCTLALWHDPMWISSSAPPTPTDPYPNHGYRLQSIRGVWRELYNGNADVVVNGGFHIYERFAPMRYEGEYTGEVRGPEFAADSARGIRQFTTGLVGDGPLNTPDVVITHPLSEYRRGGNGVLKLTLGDGMYTWEFLNTPHSRVRDRGVGTCH